MSDKNTPESEAAASESRHERLEAEEAAADAEAAAIFEEVTAPGYGKDGPPDEEDSSDAGRDTEDRTDEGQGEAEAAAGKPQRKDTAAKARGAAGQEGRNATGRTQQDQTELPDWDAVSDQDRRAAYEAASSELESLRRYRSSNEGRIAAYQRQVDDLRRQMTLVGSPNVSRETQGEQGAGKTGTEAPQSLADFLDQDKEWGEVREEYSELAKPMERVLKRFAEVVGQQGQQLSAISQTHTTDTLRENAQSVEESIPGWQDYMAGRQEDFRDWLSEQPRAVVEAALENQHAIVDPRNAAMVVRMFQDHMGDGASQQETGGQSRRQTNGSGNGAGSQRENQSANNGSGRRQRQLQSAASGRPQSLGVGSGIPEEGDPEHMFAQMEKAGLFSK